ncbi:hypothetical protein, partial [Frankia sp. CiP1_Cm_nod1]|uniref:hypothetical protein n=1 Tax=Frankia sp. CiP1_Cm_nod1 TaxID=2897160 RepID=UPI0020250153
RGRVHPLVVAGGLRGVPRPSSWPRRSPRPAACSASGGARLRHDRGRRDRYRWPSPRFRTVPSRTSRRSRRRLTAERPGDNYRLRPPGSDDRFRY